MTESIQPVRESALVVGLGMTGFSVIRHLAQTDCRITVADSRDLPPYLSQVKQRFPKVDLVMGGIPYERFAEFDQIITSPGIKVTGTDSGSGKSPISDIELFARSADAPVIAITGSNGKSTVTMLVTNMLLAAGLEVKTGGNIGIPALDLLEGESPDFHVLELSSFQLENTRTLEPVAATVLNISADHMDRYPGLNDYADAKFRIFDHARHRIINRDDQITERRVTGGFPGLSFGLNAPGGDEDFGIVGPEGERLMARGDKTFARVDQMTLQGEQNVANALAAFALVESVGVKLTTDVIRAALDYRGLPHRCEMVREVNQVKWINDSKGTNPAATIAAIKGLRQPIILILGGQGKGADFSYMAEVIADKVAHSFIYGEDAEIILACFKSASNITRVATLDEAVERSFSLAKPGDTILFSPACASYDMFNSYEYRGDRFRQLVLELVDSGGNNEPAG